MPMKDTFVPMLAASLVFTLVASTAAAQPRSVYQQTQYKGQEIGKLTGDVYYARMDDYLSVFMVTPDGIVLVEPIGTEFATWLKGELASRFKVPVKYVIYSHHHWDHGSGASVYADTARIIGHEAMMPRLAMPPADTPLPQNARTQDRNANGQIEQEEAQGNLQAQFALYDQDRNGALSGAEVTRGPLALVRPPDLTFRDPVTITLGGKRVEVLPKPTAHADDNTIVRFADGAGVLFASDWITVKRVPFGGDVATKPELALAKTVESLEFEYFVCSHGMLGKKADVTANIRYREELREAVAKSIAAGQTLEQAQAGVTMDGYKEWEFYAQQRPANVTGTYRALTSGQ
jgi:glyoxylase-like metal-dependent hydrolase (beta-lactamase superfamily II)